MSELAELPGVFAPLLPLEFSGTQTAAGAVPRLGEHTREVLFESGISQMEIDDLAERRIVECLPPRPLPKSNS
jgi:crotonobetainyl-CoA:carnitine CoA-transferase CaiB-like acyl-CoA transferase